MAKPDNMPCIYNVHAMWRWLIAEMGDDFDHNSEMICTFADLYNRDPHDVLAEILLCFHRNTAETRH